MQKARFFSVVLLLFLASLFLARFSLYPFLRVYLALRYGVHLDISTSEICGLSCIRFSSLTVEQPGVFRFSAEGITVAITVRQSGMFEFDPHVSRFEMERGSLVLYDTTALKNHTTGNLSDEELPPFLFDEIALKNLSIEIHAGTGSVRLSDASLEGNGWYALTIPQVSYTHPHLRKPIRGQISLVFRAYGTDYSLESLEGTADGFSLAGAAEKEVFTGTMRVRLDYLNEWFPEQNAAGEIVVDYRVSGWKNIPKLAADVRANRLRWRGFSLYDAAASISADPKSLAIEQLLLFDRGSPVLSLGGVMEWDTSVLRGSVRLSELDFRNTLGRFGVPCWVDMWLSGKVDYTFSFNTLEAEYTTDLVVKGFGVHTDTRFAILELSDPYLVSGRGSIHRDRVILSAAEVRLRDDTTHLFLHDSWFDFTDSFQILISPASWIDLSRVRAIAELATTGKGAIDVSITSKYENPRIVGHFKGKDCSVAGFDTEQCDLTIELKDLILSFVANSLVYRSIRTEGSWATIDFNKEPFLISFLFNQVNGSIADIGGVLRTKIPDVGGRFAFTVEGRYRDYLVSLVGKAQAERIRWHETPVADRLSLSFGDEGDLLRITKGTITRGDSIFSIEGTVDRRSFTLDLQGKLDAFFEKDFPFLNEVTFTAPRLTATAEGHLSSPRITVESFLGGVSYQGVFMGNFAGNLLYDAGQGRTEVTGNIGDAASFRGNLRGLDISSMNADIVVRNFIHKKGDFFFKTSFEARLTAGEIDARIGKLIIEKKGIFVRNARPFCVKGKWDDFVVDPVVFDGETVNGTVRGSFRKGKPHLEGTGTIFPAALAAFMNIPFIGAVTGNTSFTFSLIGDALAGNLTLSEVGFTVIPYEMPVQHLNGNVSFENGTWYVKSLIGLIGGGKLEVKGTGTFSPTWNGNGKITVINAATRHPSVGHFSLSAYLDVVAEKETPPLISGDIEIKNLTYRHDFSLVDALTKTFSRTRPVSEGSSEKQMFDPHLNLHVTGRNALHVANNVLRADIVLDTQILGTLSRPTVDGTIRLTTGEILFKQNRFSLDRGLVTLETSDTVRPYLDIQGTTRLYARSKQTEYKVVLTVTGYADNPVIRVSSLPHLEETDIYAILLWGDFFDPTQPGAENLALVAATDILGISAEVKKNFRLSQFELTPRYSEVDYKTVLKIVAVKELYPFLTVAVESNPADPADQMFGLTYRGSNFDLSLDWKYKNKLEADYGGVGISFGLTYLFE